MGINDRFTPISYSYWDAAQLGCHQGSSNGNLYLFGDFYSVAHMFVMVSNCNHNLESSSLTGLGLLLITDDLQDIIVEKDLLVGAFLDLLEENVHNLNLLDGDRVVVHIFQ
jgi:hypothetical protein